jgi:hypothetical protein
MFLLTEILFCSPLILYAGFRIWKLIPQRFLKILFIIFYIFHSKYISEEIFEKALNTPAKIAEKVEPFNLPTYTKVPIYDVSKEGPDFDKFLEENDSGK